MDFAALSPSCRGEGLRMQSLLREKSRCQHLEEDW